MILTWYFYERSPLITNGYQCWKVASFKPLPSKFEPNPFIILHVTVSESNQTPNYLPIFYWSILFCIIEFVGWRNQEETATSNIAQAKKHEEVKWETKGYFGGFDKSYYFEGIEKLKDLWTRCIELKGKYIEK